MGLAHMSLKVYIRHQKKSCKRYSYLFPKIPFLLHVYINIKIKFHLTWVLKQHNGSANTAHNIQTTFLP